MRRLTGLLALTLTFGLSSCATLLPQSSCPGPAQQQMNTADYTRRVGLLVLAHGTHLHAQHPGHVPLWESMVEDAIAPLKARYALKVAYGMADARTIEQKLQEFEQEGYAQVNTVQLFVSSTSPIIANNRYLFGKAATHAGPLMGESLSPLQTSLCLYLAPPMDAHPLISQVLYERALALSHIPSQETVLLVAHGPDSDEEDQRWLQMLHQHAAYIQARL